MLSKIKSYGNVASVLKLHNQEAHRTQEKDACNWQKSRSYFQKKSRFCEPGLTINRLENYFTITLPVAIRLAERSSRLIK